MINGLFLLAFVLLLSFRMFPVAYTAKNLAVLLAIAGSALAFAEYFHAGPAGWAMMLIVVDLYLLFYSKAYEGLAAWCIAEGVFFVLLALVGACLSLQLFPMLFGTLLYLWMLYVKKRLQPTVLLGILFFMTVFLWIAKEGHPYLSSICMLILLYLMEYLHQGYTRAFAQTEEEFQNQVMMHHYEEVRAVYLNMRGWRHDYHNHIQTMKAYLSLGQTERIGVYLNELEQDLTRVDQLVKSGNLMVDAILNSKLSLANERRIRINCKAVVPEKVPVSDIDICVLVGNLMDNAIEACEQIEPEKRFIRIYMDVVQSQLYLSIMNSAREDPDFNQKNYISEKRGNHGNGIKRVKLTVDKYDGYLNLKNEPGVFASELMIPM